MDGYYKLILLKYTEQCWCFDPLKSSLDKILLKCTSKFFKNTLKLNLETVFKTLLWIHNNLTHTRTRAHAHTHTRTHAHTHTHTHAHTHSWNQKTQRYMWLLFPQWCLVFSAVQTLSLKMCVRSCWLVRRDVEKKWIPGPGNENQRGISEATVNTIHCPWPLESSTAQNATAAVSTQEDWKNLKLLLRWHTLTRKICAHTLNK